MLFVLFWGGVVAAELEMSFRISGLLVCDGDFCGASYSYRFSSAAGGAESWVNCYDVPGNVRIGSTSTFISHDTCM